MPAHVVEAVHRLRCGVPHRRRLSAADNGMVSRWSRVGVALGVACACVVLLSPQLFPTTASAVVTASVLPVCFFAAGSIAHLLRAGHVVSDRLLAVGVLHLAGIVGAIVIAGWPGERWITVPVGILSAILYALGFVALLDLLARFPTGSYAWKPVSVLVRGAAVFAVVLAIVSFLGNRQTLSVLDLPGDPNRAYVSMLQPLSSSVLVIVVAPIVGLGLLVARYPAASSLDRSQMRWPIMTTVALAVGLLTTPVVENVVGAELQSAIFIAFAAGVPASFLIGLLRHTEQAERLAAVEASRARLVEAADAERRRIERDLHDGAQQQLLALLARVELVRTQLRDDDTAMENELRDISHGIRQAHRDLRELARGIHPTVLTDHGLAEAVRSTLAQLPLSAQLEVSPEVERSRYDEAIETAAYFLVLEGLANAMKHAAAHPHEYDSPHLRTRWRYQSATLDAGLALIRVMVPGPGYRA
jgi:signal transduction histidine kinase